MAITIWFDMDGTLADLYGVDDWLLKLRAEDDTPYKEAKPLVNMSVLARYLNKAKRAGFHVGVISWSSKNGSAEYDEKVATAKKEWLKKHLKSVKFDKIFITHYGIRKDKFCSKEGLDVLFDDNDTVRQHWSTKGRAYNEQNIIPIIKTLINEGV